jgi:hypothetical protein
MNKSVNLVIRVVGVIAAIAACVFAYLLKGKVDTAMVNTVWTTTDVEILANKQFDLRMVDINTKAKSLLDAKRTKITDGAALALAHDSVMRLLASASKGTAYYRAIESIARNLEPLSDDARMRRWALDPRRDDALGSCPSGPPEPAHTIIRRHISAALDWIQLGLALNHTSRILTDDHGDEFPVTHRFTTTQLIQALS